MEACAGIRDVVNVIVILGSGHGIGPFHLPFRTLVVLQDCRHLKTDIGIAIVICEKDTSTILKNIIEGWLTVNLKLIKESSLQLSVDSSGFVQCMLHPKSVQQQHNITTIWIQNI